MTTNLKITRDYLDTGFWGFMKEANKTYGDRAYLAIENCKDPRWMAIKETFFSEVQKPFLLWAAEVLERAIISYSPKKR